MKKTQKNKFNSKNKGSQFERDLSVILSKWASGNEREDLFWRSSMSGGRATVAKKKGTSLSSQAGDLSAVHSDGQPFLDKFYVEAKNYKDINFAGILTNTGHLMKFWEAACTEAASYKRQPMLIVKQNRLPIVVFLQTAGFRILNLSEAQAILSSPRNSMYGYRLTDFVQWAKPL